MILIAWNQRKNKSRIERLEDELPNPWIAESVLANNLPSNITVGALCTCEVSQVTELLQPFAVIGEDEKEVGGAGGGHLLNLPGIRIEGYGVTDPIQIGEHRPFSSNKLSFIPTVLRSFSEVFLFYPSFLNETAKIERDLIRHFIN